MSKNKQKKLKRQAAIEIKKTAKKAEEQAAKRAERKLSDVRRMIAGMSEHCFMQGCSLNKEERLPVGSYYNICHIIPVGSPAPHCQCL